MPNKGVTMCKLKTVLRLYYEAKLSQRKIAKSLQLSVGVVNKYLQRAIEYNLSWPLPAEYEDEAKLAVTLSAVAKKTVSPEPAFDFKEIHQELKRKSTTLQLLWEEYSATTSNPTSYSHFCLLYRSWKKTQPQSMRQTHKAGDKVFVDYAGQTVEVVDPDTGEIRKAQIFVGVLGASNYTYAEATWSQQLPDWIGSHVRMLNFFGGVPALIVPDNLRSGVNKACRYEPEINQTYADFIDYYKTAVLPARPVKPKDKAKAENGVLIVERWILARLRNHKFIGLAELNQAIAELIHYLNQKPFKKLPGSRATAFAEIDQPVLNPLPLYPYEYANFKKARVHIDYHVELEHHYYSVPYAFIGKEINIRFTTSRMECWYQGRQIAIHVRSYKKGAHTTLPEHMPKSHRKHMEWTPGRFLNWAAQIGLATTSLVKHLLENKPHPEQGYRSCLGLLNLAKRFGENRLEKACSYALKIGAKTRRSVESILVRNMENTAIASSQVYTELPIDHENLRGKNYYN
jgi:transposase